MNDVGDPPRRRSASRRSRARASLDFQGGETAGLILKDVGTSWRDLVATADKSAAESRRVMELFAGRHKVCEFYSDCSRELKAAAKDVKWPHSLATPHRPSSRSSIERELQLLLESSRCALNQSGLPLNWWPRAARYQAMALNFVPSAWSQVKLDKPGADPVED